MSFASERSPDFFDGGSFHGVHLQHVFQKANDRGVEILRGKKDPITDLLKERWHMVVVEGERPTQQGIEDDAAAPDVHLWAGIQPECECQETECMITEATWYVYSAPSWKNKACRKL